MTTPPCPREAVVILLDSNETMLEEICAEFGNNDCFLGTTKWDVARYVAYEIVSSTLSSSIDVVSVIVLRTPCTHHHFCPDQILQVVEPNCNQKLVATSAIVDDDGNYDEHDPSDDKRSESLFPNLTEWSGKDPHLLLKQLQNYTIRRNNKRKLQYDEKGTENNQKATTRPVVVIQSGDFLNGLVLGTDTLYRHTEKNQSTVATPQPPCRMLLMTDGKHKAKVDPKHLLVAMDSLKRMKCKLEVLLFRDEADCQVKTYIDSNQSVHDGKLIDGEMMKSSETYDGEATNDVVVDDDDEENDSCSSGESDDDDDDDDNTIQAQNEALLWNLANKLEGTVLVPRDMQEILDKIARPAGRDAGSDLTGSQETSNGPQHRQVPPGTYDEEAIAPSVIKTQGPRRESSLRPSLGLRIYWNGNDDVPLREWLQRIRPSQHSSGDCSWIQVNNVNQSSPGFYRDSIDDDSDEEMMIDIDEMPKFAKYEAPLNEITKIIKCGKRVSKASKEKCVKEIMRLAKQDKETVGKWLVYVKPSEADEVWEKIARATALGYLGCSSKIAPTANGQDESTVICVYVQDSTDKREVQRVLKTLYYDLKVTSGLSNFKPDIYTYLNIYRNNPWRLKPTLYSWKDAIAWEL
ncbi:DUF1917 domain containing protein [Nitzschia inconspicua]|uniref:DUF1917 domain containing protein n=1 Tax=Nitzschia inconspicua TaxID=303405 RepID=A0A9K3LDT7_9STRA|nr:DUF1917 domain containing protein [Nitzschia inconspicua]